MKTKPQYFFALTIIVALLLGSCSPAPTTNTSISLTSTITFTSVPTEISSTPTETPDPNAPDNYTRYENGIYYLDKITEKGNTLTYTWDKERNSWNRLIFTGYAWDISPVTTGVDAAGKQLYPDGFMTNVYVDGAIEDEQALPALSHHDNNDPQNALNWSSFIYTLMTDQMASKGLIKDGFSFDFGTFWGSHDYHIDFTNADGPQRFDISGDSTMTVHIRNDAEALKANMATNGFSETKADSNFGPLNHYMVKIWTENGNLFVDIAPTLRPASTWTQKQIMEMVMFGFSAVLGQGSDLSHPVSGIMTSSHLKNDKLGLKPEIGASQWISKTNNGK